MNLRSVTVLTRRNLGQDGPRKLIYSDCKRLRARGSADIGVSSHIGVGTRAQGNAIDLARCGGKGPGTGPAP